MTQILLQNARLFDCTGREPQTGASVLVDEGRIARISNGQLTVGDGARVIDCGGMTVMPGLTDAHVHFGLTEDGEQGPPESYVSYVVKVIENIRLALDEGFTTVRDAGGLDPAYAIAVEDGQIRGPRILPSGSFITQTGGHGDQRPRWDERPLHSIPGLVAHSEVCDGPDEVRRAARLQLRRGATQVKLMASGGVMSPTDPIDSLQFGGGEMRAAVEEAESFGTYVLAHCHTSGAVNRALDAGVRSIEHGSIIDAATARRIAEAGAYLVPTLVIIEILQRAGGVPEFARTKLERVRGAMRASLALARDAGVPIGSGSDLLGPRQRRRASEIAEKAKEMGAMQALISATATNAALFRMPDRIGTVEEGKDADIIAVAGDPLADAAVLIDAANIRLVLKQGAVVKDCLG
ncbi:MAG TPA: amidohydrolase family protein [Dehalococcoidia bacterium]|nr:amidohydrolase family protein [Dehalococcoidia bacterium]